MCSAFMADQGDVFWRDSSTVPTMNESFLYLALGSSVYGCTGGPCLAFAYTGRICVGSVACKIRKHSANLALMSSTFFLYLESSSLSSSFSDSPFGLSSGSSSSSSPALSSPPLSSLESLSLASPARYVVNSNGD